MNPLQKGHNTPESVERTRRAMLEKPPAWWAATLNLPVSECTPERIEQALRATTEGYEVWLNEIYTVHLREEETAMGRLVHLSIKRNDREPVSDWRDKQAIKNQLCGEDASGVELYPCEDRVVDMANQYHIWVFKDGTGRDAFEEIGFGGGIKSDGILADSKQRPREKCLENID